MVTQRDYSAELVKAAHSVLLELFHLFGEYRERKRQRDGAPLKRRIGEINRKMENG
jgi:hypothetical protein